MRSTAKPGLRRSEATAGLMLRPASSIIITPRTMASGRFSRSFTVKPAMTPVATEPRLHGAARNAVYGLYTPYAFDVFPDFIFEIACEVLQSP